MYLELKKKTIFRAMTTLQNITSGPLFFELFTFVAFLAINVFIFDRVSLTRRNYDIQSNIIFIHAFF